MESIETIVLVQDSDSSSECSCSCYLCSSERSTAKICDDEELLAKGFSKCTIKNDSESRNEVQINETIITAQLLDLNDDCLIEIFGHLHVIDLGSVAHVCTRFQQLAELIFKRKCNVFDFSNRLISNREVTDILRNFGQTIMAFTVVAKPFNKHKACGRLEDELLPYIAEYCGKTLHTLILEYFNCTAHAMDALNMLSHSLQSLSFCGRVLTIDCVFHLSNFSALRSLTITNTINCYALMETFPALEYLELDNISITTNRILQQFIVAHKQLKSLIIINCKGISSNIFRSIGKYLANLKRLTFVRSLIAGSKDVKWDSHSLAGSESIEKIQNNILHLDESKSLLNFEWYCDFLSIGNLLAKMLTNNITMKVLSLGGIVDDETIKSIGKIKNLEILGLYQTIDLENQHLVRIAEELTQLKEFYIGWQKNLTFDVLIDVLRHTKQLHYLRIHSEEDPLDPKLYNEILDIVKECGNGIKLTIRIYCNAVKDLLSQQTIRSNKNWLIIEREKHFF